MTVAMDEKNTGSFHVCFTENVQFKESWWKKMHLGISATTGQLADNHDILSVETVLGEGDPMKVSESKSKELTELEENESNAFKMLLKRHSVNEDALTANERGLLKVAERCDQQERLAIRKLKRELEHKIVGRSDERRELSGGRVASQHD